MKPSQSTSLREASESRAPLLKRNSLRERRRPTFGKPIAEHQAIQIKLADMATRIEASRLLIQSACAKRDRGERCDLEGGMAETFRHALDGGGGLFEAMRIMGANGYSKDFPVERDYRDAPLVVDRRWHQRVAAPIIARSLLKKYNRTRSAYGLPRLRDDSAIREVCGNVARAASRRGFQQESGGASGSSADVGQHRFAT